MGLFGGLLKKKGTEIGAPVKGVCVPITEVSDPTFGEKILGEGIAIRPVEGNIYAPADGTLSAVFDTGHAAAVTTDNQIEILIHVGLDTVELNGKYYTKCVEVGQRVKKGDLLLKADLEEIKKAGYDTITPVVICNSQDFKTIEVKTGMEVNPGDVVMYIS